MIPILNYQDIRSIRNTCFKCNRLMLHAEDHTVYTIPGDPYSINVIQHKCRPRNN